MNLQALAQLVPPLHGCTLCAHSMERDGVRHCYAPAVREVFGVQALIDRHPLADHPRITWIAPQ